MQPSTSPPPPLPAHPPRKGTNRVLKLGLPLAVFAVLILGATGIVDAMLSPTVCLQSTVTEGKVRSVEAALMQYKTVHGFYPTPEQGLDALVNHPSGDPQPTRWTQFVKAEAIIDPWEQKIQYRNPGHHNVGGYDLFSLGPDGVESEDDIGNW